MKRLIMPLVIIGLLISGMCSCNSSYNEVADLVVKGTIYTAEKENNGEASAFAVKDGKYIYVGDEQGINKYIKEGKTQVINNNGGLVIPGATEGHGHFLGIDSLVKKLPCYYSQYEDIKKELKEYVKQIPTPKFFVSWGLDYQKYVSGQDGWDHTMNYAKELDELDPLCKSMPIILIDNGGHQALCNGYALKNAGLIDEDYKIINKVRGGNIYETTLEPKTVSGWVGDEIVMYVIGKNVDFSVYGDDFFIDSTRNTIKELHSRGFTNYLDAYINVFTEDGFHKILNSLDTNHELTINISTFSTVRSYEDNEYENKISLIKDLADQYHSEHFDPYNVKLFADGVVEAFTGWMIDEYPFHELLGTNNHGNQVWSQEELNKLVLASNQKGLNVHTHTFGDAACRATIDAYINAENITNTHYLNTLAHVRNIRRVDIEKAAKHNIGMASNLIWHTQGNPPEDYAVTSALMGALYPEGSYFTGYPMRSLLDAGVLVSSSTDAPCGEAIKGTIQNIIEVATTGIAPTYDYHVFNPDELITVREVLDCLTINGAKQLGIDNKCGSIKVGKNADFVVLDKNFLNYVEYEDLKTIHESKIEYVYFEGNKVYPTSN